MKTITEFQGSTLKNALKTRQDLVAAGKTPEELPAAMGEALKLEGDKLNLILSALEVVEKKTDDLKRVVVWTLQEGEKAPRGTEQKGEHYFAIEFFPPLPGQGKKKHGREDKRRDGKRGDRKKGKRRTQGRRPDRAPRGPAPVQVTTGPATPLPPIKPKTSAPAASEPSSEPSNGA